MLVFWSSQTQILYIQAWSTPDTFLFWPQASEACRWQFDWLFICSTGKQYSESVKQDIVTELKMMSWHKKKNIFHYSSSFVWNNVLDKWDILAYLPTDYQMNRLNFHYFCKVDCGLNFFSVLPVQLFVMYSTASSGEHHCLTRNIQSLINI